MDLAELTQRAQEGKPLYGTSDQPLWVQGAAHNNSAFSQLKLREFLSFSYFKQWLMCICRCIPLVHILQTYIVVGKLMIFWIGLISSITHIMVLTLQSTMRRRKRMMRSNGTLCSITFLNAMAVFFFLLFSRSTY